MIKVAIDCDSVLTDTERAWYDYYTSFNLVHGHTYSCHWTKNPSWDYWQSVCEECFSRVLVDERNILNMDPQPGAYSALAMLAPHAELHFLTARRKEVEAATMRWLLNHGMIQFFSAIEFQWDKAAYCLEHEINILIDDSPRNILALQGSDTVPIVFNQPYNRDLEGLRGEWPEIVGHIMTAIAADYRQQEETDTWVRRAADCGALTAEPYLA